MVGPPRRRLLCCGDGFAAEAGAAAAAALAGALAELGADCEVAVRGDAGRTAENVVADLGRRGGGRAVRTGLRRVLAEERARGTWCCSWAAARTWPRARARRTCARPWPGCTPPATPRGPGRWRSPRRRGGACPRRPASAWAPRWPCTAS
ncbi:unnamed protein product [Prorocentrum cordatum]|uniref:Uncharacterized protein n=1 Tax=Prorocentrum cordatum TaxID=2364126 RepID=A0ABN9X4R0_9DINO|nr:unnamed protein product [Polarella glacialis]